MSNPGTRRAFLRGLTYLGSAAATAGQLRPLLAAATDGDSYWNLVREQFPIRRGVIPMNAANLCPSPRSVAEYVAELTRDLDGDVSFHNREKFNETLEVSRRKVAAHLGVSPGEIALVRNTSEANNTVNIGMPLGSGDEVVLFDQNHPTNSVSWDVRAARFGFTVKRVGVPATAREPGEIVRLFEAALGPRTKVLSVTHVSSSTGLRLPARELCAMARRRGVWIHMDGAQSWGALHVNLREMGCDSYSASAHKWLCGPKEAGLLYVRQERIRELWPAIVGVGWGNQAETGAQGARKFETLGQRDDACLAAVGAAVDFHQMIGPERIEKRMLELNLALQEGLRKLPGVTMITPADQRLSAGITIVRFAAKDTRKVYDEIYARHRIGASTSGGLRFSPHLYNTLEDVERAIRAVAESS